MGATQAVLAASSDNDPDRERVMVDAFTRRRVDGLILNTVTEIRATCMPSESRVRRWYSSTDHRTDC
jgi:LacI family transcriptional regulator